MKVWRKQSTKWTKNGKRVAKGTKGAKPTKAESKRFYGTLRLANGKRKQQPLNEDKTSSVTLLRRLQGDEDKRRALGVTEQDEQRQRNALDALGDYERYLRNRDVTERYVKFTKQRIEALLHATKTKTLGDIDASRVSATLALWRKRKHGVETSNCYVVAIKGFTRWAWRERLTPDDPLAGLRRLNAGKRKGDIISPICRS